MARSSPDQLAEFLGLMPFSQGVGVEPEIADPTTWLAPWPGLRNDAPPTECFRAERSWPLPTLPARSVHS